MLCWNHDCIAVNFQDAEKEFELQIGMKQEMEVALKLLEKDVHDKQETIVSLRKQLDDVKTINIDISNKLQVILFNMLIFFKGLYIWVASSSDNVLTEVTHVWF